MRDHHSSLTNRTDDIDNGSIISLNWVLTEIMIKIKGVIEINGVVKNYPFPLSRFAFRRLPVSAYEV